MNGVSAQDAALIYKICAAQDWQAALACGRYAGSADDRRDGFIHFSTAAQLEGTADKHFKGQKDLLLIAVDGAALGAALKWEASRADMLFPHLYGTLETAAAVWTLPLPLGASGRLVLPGRITRC